MRLALNWKLIGLMVGLVLGLLFIILGWKAFLILLGFLLLGFLIGGWVDSHADIKRKLAQLLNRFLRS